MINFEEEIERFRPSLEVEEVSDAIVKSDLTRSEERRVGKECGS